MRRPAISTRGPRHHIGQEDQVPEYIQDEMNSPSLKVLAIWVHGNQPKTRTVAVNGDDDPRPPMAATTTKRRILPGVDSDQNHPPMKVSHPPPPKFVVDGERPIDLRYPAMEKAPPTNNTAVALRKVICRPQMDPPKYDGVVMVRTDRPLMSYGVMILL